MKHSQQCVQFQHDELVALAGLLTNPITVPQSLQDVVSHLPAAAAAPAGSTVPTAAVTATQTTITLAAPLPGLTAGDFLSIDTEHVMVRSVNPAGTTITVFRGVGTVAAATHTTASPVVYVPATATDRVRAILSYALTIRSDLTTTYAWPYLPTPPNFVKGPQQVALQQGGGTDSETPGEVIPPAPWLDSLTDAQRAELRARATAPLGEETP